MSEEMHNISRIEQERDNGGNTYGWYVRVQRDQKRISKLFSDGVHGGKEKALEKAKTYRDEVLDEWERYCGPKSSKPIQYKKSNVGYPGLTLTEKKERNGPAKYFNVNYTDEDGNRRSKSVYIAYVDDPEFDRKYEEKLEKAKKLVDELNYKRFGGRWHFFKKHRAKINDTDS